MLAYPLANAVILAVLTVLVARQYAARRRPQELAWGAALAVGLVATLAFVASDLAGGSPPLFRLYYLGGAVLVAPLLGLGSTYLLPGRGWSRAMLAVTVAAGAVAAAGLLEAPLDRQALAHLGLAPGTRLVSAPLVLVPVIVGNTLGTVAVVGVALWTLGGVLRGRAPRRLARTGALVAAGALVLAAAGSMARLGGGAGFWTTMAVGWLVLAAGVWPAGGQGATGTSRKRGS